MAIHARNFIILSLFSLLLVACTAKKEDANLPSVTPPATLAILSIDPFSVREDRTSNFLFTLSKPATTDVSFTWTIGTVTVSPAADFTSLTGHVTIPAGSTTAVVPMGVVNDSLHEGSETFKLTISAASAQVSVPTPMIQFVINDDETPAYVTQVTSSTANGSYKAGQSINVQLVFSIPVVVTGTPNIQLETGLTDRLANYISGSGTSTLNFTYVVQAGDITSDLDYISTTAVNVNGGTIKDTDGFNTSYTLAAPGAATSLGANKNIIIDTSAPTVTNVTSTTVTGSYTTATVIPISITFSEAVNVTGTPRLQLETGTVDHYATYASGSGTNTLIFNYTVQAGDTSSHLDYINTASLSLNGGTIVDAASNGATLTLPSTGAAGSLGGNKSLIIDTTAPTVADITATTANGHYRLGQTIAVTAIFSESVIVTGTPKLTLETGTTDQVISYVSGSGTNTLLFNYVVQAGDTSADLDYISTSALALNGGTILDAAGNVAVLTLANPAATHSLGANKDFVIDTTSPTVTQLSATTANGAYKAGANVDITISFSENVVVTGTPKLTLETGTTDRLASYLSGSGTSTLTFRYTVVSGDTNSNLDATSTTALALSGGTIKDLSLNSATLTLPLPGAANSLGVNKSIIIDTTAPTAPTGVIDGTWLNSLSTSPTISWSAGADVAGSGVDHYEISIGTSAGATDTLNWTTLGAGLSATQSGLTLSDATTYYANIRTVDLAGNVSTAASGDGWTVDVTPPSQSASLDDGTTYPLTTETPTLTWAAASDSASGISSYQIAIGTSAGASDVYAWTSVGTGTTTQITGLNLTLGNTYYASVRAIDVAGNTGTARSGDGWIIGWLQQSYLKSSSNTAADKFGSSVAISGNSMAVGIPGDTSSTGKVIIYTRSGANWAQQAVLTASDAATGDQFGYKVALDGDTVAIGAPTKSSSRGSVYIFTRSGSTWSQQTSIQAVNADTSDDFGLTLALSADTLVVGAPYEDSASKTIVNGTTASSDNTASSAGAAYVYVRSSGVWSQQAYLKAPNAHSSDRFGAAVAIDADTIVVGAYYESGTGNTIINSSFPSSHTTTSTKAGSAYIFFRTSGTWATQSYIKSSNSQANDQFGTAVAISGDTAIIGSPYDSSSGAAFVYKRTASAWAEERVLRSSNLDSGDTFGAAVSIDGNLAVVGAKAESSTQTTVTNGPTASTNNSASASGAAYVFNRSGTSWSQLSYLKAPNGEATDNLGTSVSISGNSIAVGAPLEDSNQNTITNGPTASSDNSNSSSGAVYLFNR